VTRIKAGAVIRPFVYLGAGVSVGAGSELGPNAVILDRTRIGDRVRIGPGCVIGGDGFGFKRKAKGYRRIPHRGRVVIEDRVELGGQVNVDRATRGETRVGAGTKIDALVHIGHNVRIGQNCIIVAQSGLGGSAQLEDGVSLAGQVGVKDHVRIGAGSIVYAKSALFRSIPPDSRYSGIPARPHPKTLRALARLYRA
jgi:UDP-3-O-[3-hydroxymyristoyl] glucosamine N-acyltransferase